MILVDPVNLMDFAPFDPFSYYIHIIIGIIGLIAGITALSAKKGGPRHILAGHIFIFGYHGNTVHPARRGYKLFPQTTYTRAAANPSPPVADDLGFYHFCARASGRNISSPEYPSANYFVGSDYCWADSDLSGSQEVPGQKNELKLTTF